VTTKKTETRGPCGVCGQPSHRYADNDPEHQWNATACINTLRAVLDRERNIPDIRDDRHELTNYGLALDILNRMTMGENQRKEAGTIAAILALVEVVHGQKPLVEQIAADVHAIRRTPKP
jgi:hypothetical protein